MTTITNPDTIRFGAIILRGHLRLLSVGMKNSQLSGTAILAKATQLTGRSYKRAQYKQALADLNALLETL